VERVNAIAESTMPVSVALRPWVGSISVAIGGNGDGQPLIHLPDPAIVLVWRTTIDGRCDVFAVGPRTQASYYTGKDLPVCVKLRIRLGCARLLLGVEADALVDRVVRLGGLWGRWGDRLADELVELGSDSALAEHIQNALLARLPDDRSDDLVRTGLVRNAVAGLSAGVDQPSVRVGDTAQRLGISERHLRNVFTRAIGVSPKHFARITRVRAVVAGASSRSWAQLAGDAGFYDQSHMAAEFRKIMRVAPGAFTAGRLPVARC
jgi:AraC-like DNA-binding protein